MKFQCADCQKVFLYTAKKTHFLIPKDIQVDEDTTIKAGDTVETHICPYCQSLNFIEHVEPQPEIISALSCELNEVDSWLKIGYEVHALYQKTATLVKKEVKQ